jgi:hypothetical protein
MPDAPALDDGHAHGLGIDIAVLALAVEVDLEQLVKKLKVLKAWERMALR